MENRQTARCDEAVLDALGNATRRELISMLATRPQTVGEVAQKFPISRPAISKHLKVLQDAGLITHQPRGNQNLYQLDPQGFHDARDWLDGFWNSALARFRLAAENTDPKDADD